MNSELRAVLNGMQDLPDFLGVSIEGVNTRGGYGNTPLHVAAVRGDVTCGKLLLDFGAEVNAQGEHGYTPLHEAVEQGHVEFVRLLLAAGARKDIANSYGQTPEQLARLANNSEILNLFTEHEK